MIAYITVGADDIARAKRFYSAFLPALGYDLSEGPEGLGYALPVESAQRPVYPDFYVKPTFDGQSASAGNGVMVAFEASNQRQVRTLHSAALAAGGLDEGQPGFREAYEAHFYVSYLRDPQGNKLALFSNDPEEPGRGAPLNGHVKSGALAQGQSCGPYDFLCRDPQNTTCYKSENGSNYNHGY